MLFSSSRSALLPASPLVPTPTTSPADHATIQAAINAATNGDAVVVAPGTYHEQIVFNGKAITVQSTHPTTPATVAATIINGDATGSVVTFGTADPGAGVLDGFTITNGSGQSGAISCLYCSPTITNNVITGSTASIAGGGIYCYGASPIIRNNLIYGNHSDGAGLGGGIFLQSSTSLVENNTVCGNSAGSGGGIWSDGNLTTIRNNIVAFNTGGGGMQGSGATITYCDVYSNTGGNYTDGAVAGTGCIARDPLFVNAAGGDYGLKSQAGHCTAGVWVKDTVSSPCLGRGRPDLGLEPRAGAPWQPREHGRGCQHDPCLQVRGPVGAAVDPQGHRSVAPRRHRGPLQPDDVPVAQSRTTSSSTGRSPPPAPSPGSGPS